MQTITNSYRGIDLLIRLNWDRALSAGMIALALAAGGYLAAL